MSGKCLNDDVNAVKIGTEDGPFETGNTKHEWNLEELRKGHRVLAEYEYEKKPVDRGYAGRILHVDLSSNIIREIPLTEDIKRCFNGRGSMAALGISGHVVGLLKENILMF